MKAPIEGKYSFTVYCDAAFSLSINKEKLIDHFVSNFKYGYEGAKWGEKVTSNKIHFDKGNLYEFEIKYWRSDA